MNLGLLLPLGDSLKNFAEHGQDVRFVKYYLTEYSKKFSRVFVFSYENENYKNLPNNCELVCPPKNIHRYLYGLLLPFIRFFEYKKCDVFRCFHPSAAIPAIFGKICLGKKFIFNYNYDYLEWARVENKNYLIPFLFIQQWLAFKFSDRVFTADEKTKNYAEKFVPSSKVTIIRNGVDTNCFRPMLKVKDIKEKIILSVGRLETQKNYKQLIEAVSKLKQKTKLIIVGKGSLKKELIKTALKLEVKLEIIDMVPNNKLPKIYNSADVYVQPSLMEAPVKALLEAMSCGLPCVATNVVGIRDLISNGQTGFLTNLSANDLSKKIAEVLSNNKNATKMGLKARESVVDKYNLPKFIEAEIKILSEI